MRDPKRISEIIGILQKHWEKYPDLRFFQMMENLQYNVSKLRNSICDLFYLEDNELLQLLKKIEKQESDKMSNTLFVNIFGAPGAGKSTTAAGVFSFLKISGINAELVTEYAKEVVWEEDFSKLDDQKEVFEKQFQRLSRVDNKVEVAVTDSPILLSNIYNAEHDEELIKLVNDTHNNMNTLNFFVRRVKAYNPVGRMQTADESDVIADKIRNMLDDNHIVYTVVDGNESAMTTITKIIFEKLRPGQLVCVDLKIEHEKIA